MSFKQFNVAKIANQSRKIFDSFIYKTNDTCAEVEAAGYFDECRFLINDPDSWNNSIIEVLASDCYTKGIIDNSGNYIPLLGVGDVFCPSLGLAAFFVVPATTNIITGDSVDFAGTLALDPEGVISANGTTVGFSMPSFGIWFETTITAVSGANTTIGTCLNIFEKTGLDGVVIIPNIGGVAEGYKCSEVFDEFPVPLAGFVNTSLTLPYTVQTRISSSGEISYEDTAGNSGSLGIYPTVLTEPLQFNPIGVSNPQRVGYTGLESGSYNLNVGYSQSVIPVPEDFKTYCDITPPPVGFCRLINLVLFLENDSTSVVNSNEVTTTSLATNPLTTIGVALSSDNSVQAKINTDKFAFEMIAQEPSLLGANIFGVTFGETDFLGSNPAGGFVLSVPELGTGVGDWDISFIEGFAEPPPLISNLTITFPYIVKVVYSGDNLTFKDNQVPANTGVLGTSVGLSNTFGGFLMVNGVNNSAAGNTQTLKVEGNKQNFVIDFENDALSWCELEQGGAIGVPYDYIELFVDGEAGFFDRVAGWTTVATVSNLGLWNSSYSILNEIPLDNFVFESVTIASDLDATSGGKQNLYFTGDAFGSIAQFGLITDQVTSGSSETRVGIVSSDNFNNQNDNVIFLFKLPTELNFVTALIPTGINSVRLCYKTSKQTVFFDEVELANYGNNRAVTTNMFSNSSAASGLDYRVQYNGEDADLVINDYPLGTLSYQGDPLTKTNMEVKNANWLLDYDLTIPETIDDFIGITNGGLDATAFLAQNAGFMLNCARFVKDDFASTFAVTFQITTPPFVGGLPNRFRLELDALNKGSRMAIEFVGADLILTREIGGALQAAQLIKANYIQAVGDQFCLAYDSSTNAINGILQQGGVLFETGNWGMGSVTGSWMPRAGHDLAVGIGVMQISNQYENANLTAGVLKTELILLGAKDIMGVPFS